MIEDPFYTIVYKTMTKWSDSWRDDQSPDLKLLMKVLDTIEIKKKIVAELIAALKEYNVHCMKCKKEPIKPISDISHGFMID